MPYNPSVTKELLKVRHAFDSQAAGEFIDKVFAQLEAAEADILNSNSRIATAERAQDKSEADLEAAAGTIRRLREGSSGLTELIDALKAISINPKGAKKVAADALAKMSGGAK